MTRFGPRYELMKARGQSGSGGGSVTINPGTVTVHDPRTAVQPRSRPEGLVVFHIGPSGFEHAAVYMHPPSSADITLPYAAARHFFTEHELDTAPNVGSPGTLEDIEAVLRLHEIDTPAEQVVQGNTRIRVRNIDYHYTWKETM